MSSTAVSASAPRDHSRSRGSSATRCVSRSSRFMRDKIVTAMETCVIIFAAKRLQKIGGRESADDRRPRRALRRSRHSKEQSMRTFALMLALTIGTTGAATLATQGSEEAAVRRALDHYLQAHATGDGAPRAARVLAGGESLFCAGRLHEYPDQRAVRERIQRKAGGRRERAQAAHRERGCERDRGHREDRAGLPEHAIHRLHVAARSRGSGIVAKVFDAQSKSRSRSKRVEARCSTPFDASSTLFD